MVQGMATARASGTTTTKTREIGTSLRARDDTSVQFMALSKKLTRGSYSGSVAGIDRSESRDLLGRTRQSTGRQKIAALLEKIHEYSDRRVYGNWNGWVHRHHHRARPCNGALLARLRFTFMAGKIGVSFDTLHSKAATRTRT